MACDRRPARCRGTPGRRATGLPTSGRARYRRRARSGNRTIRRARGVWGRRSAAGPGSAAGDGRVIGACPEGSAHCGRFRAAGGHGRVGIALPPQRAIPGAGDAATIRPDAPGPAGRCGTPSDNPAGRWAGARACRCAGTGRRPAVDASKPRAARRAWPGTESGSRTGRPGRRGARPA